MAFIKYTAQIALCLQEIKMPQSFLETALNQMSEEMQTMDKDTTEFKELSYYAQVLYGAIQSLNAAADIASGLSLLMMKQENECLTQNS